MYVYMYMYVYIYRVNPVLFSLLFTLPATALAALEEELVSVLESPCSSCSSSHSCCYIYIYIHIYIYIYVCVCVCVCVYIHIYYMYIYTCIYMPPFLNCSYSPVLLFSSIVLFSA